MIGTYDRHDYFKERRAALEQWTGLLTEAERGGSKIISIRRAHGAGSSDRVRITR
jgi:hypothetical protein